jgi:hypothetical protein
MKAARNYLGGGRKAACYLFDCCMFFVINFPSTQNKKQT